MDISLLQPIIVSIADAREVEPILGQIATGVAEAFDAALARVWLLQTDSECPICFPQSEPVAEERLHLRASAAREKNGGRASNSTRGNFHVFNVGKGKIGQIAQRRKPILIPDIEKDDKWVKDREWIKRAGIRCFAGHPLIFRGEVVGVLAVFTRRRLNEEEFNWLRTFANYAAIAIGNARAFQELASLRARLEAENEYLHAELANTSSKIIGNSVEVKKVLEQAALVGRTEATVLIQGESGTGKELIARAIHEFSSRKDGPFIKVNCAAIPNNLFESEFFGHVKGAFTGALKDRMGRFELASGGSLFLDEVSEIPVSLQSKLLRAIQEKEIERVGDSISRKADARLICATNRDLKEQVARNEFREDLYYRLSVFPIELPPLRERTEDIPELASHFLKKASLKLGLVPPKLTEFNLRELKTYSWPGNIRELENVMERAAILSRKSGRLDLELPQSSPERFIKSRPSIKSGTILTRSELKEAEAESILSALQKAKGKVFGSGGAAEILNMKPTTLASRMKALGLKKAYSFERGEHEER